MNCRLCAIPGVLIVALCALASGQEYPWQRDYAQVDPQGDITWTPEPFAFTRGGHARYIDFADGDDTGPGTRAQPWKHHPWDPDFNGPAGAARGVDTYVFKRGVTYRGAIALNGGGKAGKPLRLTSDPTWGDGEAVWAGSDLVTDWKRLTAHDRIPDPQQVYVADLDFAPRNLWLVRGADIQRIPLARTPNWEVETLDDVKSQWWYFDNPGQPHFQKIEVGGHNRFLGVDTRNLTEDADYYAGATVWNEYGWVMGTPYPAKVVKFFPEKPGFALEGQWGNGTGNYQLPRYSRYYLEDLPQFLDDPKGEFWFEKSGTGGRLYLRFPKGTAPDDVRVEAARHLTLIDAKAANHVEVSGITFRFTNVDWNLPATPFENAMTTPGVFRLEGSGNGITIANNRFEHVNMPIMIIPRGGQVDHLVIRDNVVHQTDHGGIRILEGRDHGGDFANLNLSILRNYLAFTGLRPTRYGQGHAIDVECAQLNHIAGNVLENVYGAGIFVFGGKMRNAKGDRPLTRILIHQNKVTHPLLNSNDWGGIETWQGGPAYVFNNISGNPGGYKMWGHRNQPDVPGAARFGHAYYMDGAFKQFYFNNIAWGKSSDPFDPLGNTSGFQEIHGFDAWVFNNTIHNFVIGSRRQAPEAGRNKYLGNIWQSIGHLVFRHAQPSDVEADPNAADAGAQGSTFEHKTGAYVSNIFYDVPQFIGAFEPSGRRHMSIEGFQRAMAFRNTLGDFGFQANSTPLRDPDNKDFRPTASAQDHGVKVFVPWGLYATVGEWHFYHVGGDPTTVMDSHFHASPFHIDRTKFEYEPRYPLTVYNASADSYTQGPLEDWTAGALKFDGESTYAVMGSTVPDADMTLPAKKLATEGLQSSDWATFDAPASMTPGEQARFTITVDKPDDLLGQQLGVHLHWIKPDGSHGGFNSYIPTSYAVDGRGPYSFAVTPTFEKRAGGFQILAFVSPDGNWKNQTHVATYTVPNAGLANEEGPTRRTPDIHRSNLLVEVVARIDKTGRDGVLLRKADAAGGYQLLIGADGRLRFDVAGAGERASVTTPAAIDDGMWRHIVVEADRKARSLRIFLNGEQVAEGTGIGAVSLANQGKLFVGGMPQGRHMRGTLEYLRIAQGTLADAKTTIGELYAWQFHGPFLRDFTGHNPLGRRDAGAIESR